MAPASVNETILDRTIRRNVLLDQYATSEIRDIVTFLNLEVEPDLLARLQQLDLGGATRSHLLNLRKDVRKIIEESYVEIKNRLQADMLDFARDDARWQVSTIAGAMPVEVSLTSPSLATIREMLRNRPIHGVLVSEWFGSLSSTAAGRINQQIMLGVVEGQGMDGVIARVRGTYAMQYGDGALGMVRRDLSAMVRTAVMGVSNNVRQATFEANTDVIKAVMWVSTLDLRTCDSCGSLDHVEFGVFSGRRPPLHLNCRCTMAPVTKSWEELGIDLPELPPGTRASMNGQVPAALTYPQWLRRQPAAIQDQILGPKKAARFRSGESTIPRYTPDLTRTLSLAELGRMS